MKASEPNEPFDFYTWVPQPTPAALLGGCACPAYGHVINPDDEGEPCQCTAVPCRCKPEGVGYKNGGQR